MYPIKYINLAYVNKKTIKKTKKELVRIPISSFLDNVKR